METLVIERLTGTQSCPDLRQRDWSLHTPQLSEIGLGMPRWLQSARYFCVLPRCRQSRFRQPDAHPPTQSCSCSRLEMMGCGDGGNCGTRTALDRGFGHNTNIYYNPLPSHLPFAPTCHGFFQRVLQNVLLKC